MTAVFLRELVPAILFPSLSAAQSRYMNISGDQVKGGMRYGSMEPLVLYAKPLVVGPAIKG